MNRNLNGMYLNELEEVIVAVGEKKFRAKQLFHHFHVEQGRDIDQIQVLPKALREKLNDYPVSEATIAHMLQSKDGSKKYLLALDDGNIIETVFMSYEDRNTLCVSSQVGCLMGCKFCASTKANFVRDLQAAEILNQVYEVEKDTGARIDNIVLMGIGEPLDNMEEVLRFIRLVTDPKGKNLSMRSITLSTSGLVPNIYRLADEGLSINLAISLHATSDKKRQETMPVAKKYSIQEILDACQYYFEKTGRRVSYEYVLIEGINDRKEDLDWMIANLQGPESHVNIIPLNEIAEYDGKAADFQALRTFQDKLTKNHVSATIRNKRGADIDGACGQLRINYEERVEERG